MILDTFATYPYLVHIFCDRLKDADFDDLLRDFYKGLAMISSPVRGHETMFGSMLGPIQPKKTYERIDQNTDRHLLENTNRE